MFKREAVFPAEKNGLYFSLLMVMIVFFLGISCSRSGNDSSNQTIDSSLTGKDNIWTYMVYIAGDNNLASAAFCDVNEMEKVGSTNEVNIIVQVEFNPLYNNSYSEDATTFRGRITKDNDEDIISSNLENIGNKNMGKKSTLSNFIQWADETYPADRYALILWSHGAGWKSDRQTGGVIKGALEDDTSQSMMALPDIAEAISDSGVTIDLIDFDACLMGMYEVAYQFYGLAEFIVFSEEVEPEGGNPYDLILNKLTGEPNMSPETLAGHTVSLFNDYYSSEKNMYVTRSAIDMAYIYPFHTKIKTFVNVISENITWERPNIQRARDASISYDFPENHDIKSFLDYLEGYTENNEILESISSLKSELSRLVISNEIYSSYLNDPIEDSCGLAIFLPTRSQVSSSDLIKYSQTAINQDQADDGNTWGDFINTLITGDDKSDSGYSTYPGNFIIKLTWNTDADLDLIIREPNGEFSSPYMEDATTNGFWSEDSTISGESVESYAAAETVEKGNYEFYVRYYKEGGTGQADTTAQIYLLDPEKGIERFELVGENILNLNDPAPADWLKEEDEVENVRSGTYSNCWFSYTLDRNSL